MGAPILLLMAVMLLLPEAYYAADPSNTTMPIAPTPPPAPTSPMLPVVSVSTGLFTWSFPRTPRGYSLGAILINGSPIEAQWAEGLLYVSHEDGSAREWMFAAEARQISASAVEFQGTHLLDSGNISFSISVSADVDPKSGSTRVAFNTSWSVSSSAPISSNSPIPYSLSVPLFGDKMQTPSWRAQMYPWAGNSTEIHQMPLEYVGVPAAVLFRPDWHVAILHGLDPASDYLNPTSWTGATGYAMDNETAPVWTFNGGENGGMISGSKYSAAVQLIFSSKGSMPEATTELVSSWRQWNRYTVEYLEVMSADTGFENFLDGRRTTDMWYPGKGYKIQSPGTNFHGGDYISLAAQTLSMYLEYLIYVETGQALWRNRSFEQVEFVLQGQNTNRSSVHYGAIHSSFRLDTMIFTSNDRDHSPGLKVDLVAMMSRYILQTWAAVLKHEGQNRTSWYQGGLAAAHWVARQQNPVDHGLPNRILLMPMDNWDDSGTPSASVVSGRALAGMPVVYNLTADPQVKTLIGGLEDFLRHRAEDTLWFTGHHPDLHGGDYEPNSVWSAVEYWLRSGNIERAVADANVGFLMLCPKQLSWVTNPTQLAFTEQQDYLQYCQYNYETRKVAVLTQLSAATGDPVWAKMAKRFTQMNFRQMDTTNNGTTKGAIYAAIADPWLKRHGGFNWHAAYYMDQLNIDLFAQLLEIGQITADVGV